MRLTQAIWICLGVRSLVIFIRAFLPLGLPEVWRQTDTLGVSLRYWLRWTVEDGSSPWWLPAVLQSGDTAGIMPMEFPLLNLLTAPLFYWGLSSGRAAAMLSLSVATLLLCLWNARLWKQSKIAAARAYPAMLLLPLLSIGADFWGKFMPDFVAMLLVCAAVGLSWERNNPWRSGLLASLGILIKPTSISVLLLLWCLPGFSHRWKSKAAWVVPSVTVGVLYYTLGMDFIRRYQVLSGLYAVEPRPVLQALSEFFAPSEALFKFILLRPFFPFGIVLVIALTLFCAKQSRRWGFSPLWGIGTLQIVLVAGLSGAHGLTHQYYFMGITPTCALILVKLWDALASRRVRWLLVAGICFRAIELSHMDLRSLYRKSAAEERLLAEECRILIHRNESFPWRKGEVFRSDRETFPHLGLCFGERQNSESARYGFFYKETTLPAGCAPVDTSAQLQLVDCGGQ